MDLYSLSKAIDMRYRTLHEYIAQNGVKKVFVRQQLGVSPFRFSALLYPDRYPVNVDKDLARRIATLLNQPVSYVRDLYDRAA